MKPSETGQGVTIGYLREVLADGARPFRYRANVHVLLGAIDGDGPTMNFPIPRAPGAFTYEASMPPNEMDRLSREVHVEQIRGKERESLMEKAATGRPEVSECPPTINDCGAHSVSSGPEGEGGNSPVGRENVSIRHRANVHTQLGAIDGDGPTMNIPIPRAPGAFTYEASMLPNEMDRLSREVHVEQIRGKERESVMEKAATGRPEVSERPTEIYGGGAPSVLRTHETGADAPIGGENIPVAPIAAFENGPKAVALDLSHPVRLVRGHSIRSAGTDLQPANLAADGLAPEETRALAIPSVREDARQPAAVVPDIVAIPGVSRMRLDLSERTPSPTAIRSTANPSSSRPEMAQFSTPRTNGGGPSSGVATEARTDGHGLVCDGSLPAPGERARRPGLVEGRYSAPQTPRVQTPSPFQPRPGNASGQGGEVPGSLAEAANRIEQLLNAAKERSAEKSPQPQQVSTEPLAQRSAPVPPPQVIVIRQSPRENRVPTAFWDRSYLGRIRPGILR